MASSESFVQYVCDLLTPLWYVRYRKMFGEYGLYCNEVFFALVCDDILYFQCDETLLAKFPETGYPYPGASLHGVADPDMLEDRDRLLALAREAYEYKKSKPGKKRK